jgi:hypothetical protein
MDVDKNIEKKNYPRLSLLTCLCAEINILLDKGKNVSFDYIIKNIDNQRLIQTIENDFNDDVDFSLFHNDQEVIDSLNYLFIDSLEAFRGQERRKAGIENNGLCLLMAVILEIIQRKKWT